MNFIINITVTEEQVRDALTSAFEGGSNYWYFVEERYKPRNCTYLSDIPTTERGYLIITALEDGPGPLPDGKLDLAQHSMLPALLDRRAIEYGLKIMSAKFPSHFSDLKNGDDDADTGDVLLQCCCFGDVIFG